MEKMPYSLRMLGRLLRKHMLLSMLVLVLKP